MRSAVPSVLLTVWQVNAMSDYKIRQIFEQAYDDYSSQGHFQPDVQHKAARAILNCKSGRLGFNLSQCTDCGHIEIHNNSCRNRSCPNCQAVLKEIWVDRRRAEVIDTPYFHVVFTPPHELNPLIYCNQKLLYGLLHRCCAETLLELSADKKWLGAVSSIIQVLHTWNQELAYHVHMHCIVSGGGLTKDGRIRKSSKNFFIRTEVLRDKFKGKYMAHLSSLYESGSLNFSSSCEKLRNPYIWKEWKNRLYKKDWCPYIKETFNGFGNAMEYTEFIRRYLMHVLPSGFQKIRYYGFLNNRMKHKNLKLIFKLQNGQHFKQRFAGMGMAELLKAVWKFDIRLCPECGSAAMKQLGRCYVHPS